ncbi:winged helix-turn-helix domain-containing protein [Spirosoma fluviale]|uniref:Transcriptional regulatory protein, C terminal n=1 Tax=Spirosoma fluviale TaxID=1597977 RepID=A0A286FHG2_9BACT|nr:winged helix-turn-helix domain-containing protein [Spirosoma fluviale]SOD82671.1 Transcriptional regulatory protein, C terminal [Spirosoma fluviale]
MRKQGGLFTGLRVLIVSGFLLMTGLLFIRFVGKSAQSDSPYAPEKVNLALRRTAHHLLRAAGDSTSRIPTVQQINPQRFRIQLGRNFDYDQLPGILQTSFRLHKVKQPYDVAVLDCARGQLQVGYSFNDLLGGNSIPCLGRSMSAGCYVLQVTFDVSAPADQQMPIWPIMSLTGLLVGLLIIGWSRNKRTNGEFSEIPPVAPDPSLLYFGGSVLDFNNLTVYIGMQHHKLTYREAKLLRLLVSHPNQVLERDQILKLVWEDEGITVGRSVDVFISRLRKLLQPDPTVTIAAVHGVGYRLEVQETRQ